MRLLGGDVGSAATLGGTSQEAQNARQRPFLTTVRFHGFFGRRWAGAGAGGTQGAGVAEGAVAA